MAAIIIVASCGSNAGITLNPSPEIKGTLAEYYDVKDVTFHILRDESRTDMYDKPIFFLDVAFTIVKNDVPGIEKILSRYKGTACGNMCTHWPPFDSDGKFLWGIGFTVEDEYHNDVATLCNGETPGGGKLLEYCVTPGQEYKYVWNYELSSGGYDEEKYKVMTKIYDGEINPNFRILIGQNVWCGDEEMDTPEIYSSDSGDDEAGEIDEAALFSDSSDDWDSVLNDYEAFVDKYIALLKKANSGDMSALNEYVSYMQKAQGLAEKLSGASGNMTSAQMNRYLSITQKMSSAAVDALGN